LGGRTKILMDGKRSQGGQKLQTEKKKKNNVKDRGGNSKRGRRHLWQKLGGVLVIFNCDRGSTIGGTVGGTGKSTFVGLEGH